MSDLIDSTMSDLMNSNISALAMPVGVIDPVTVDAVIEPLKQFRTDTYALLGSLLSQSPSHQLLQWLTQIELGEDQQSATGFEVEGHASEHEALTADRNAGHALARDRAVREAIDVAICHRATPVS